MGSLNTRQWRKAPVATTVLILAVFAGTPNLAEGTVTLAKKAKYTGRVTVAGKAAGTTFTVWQSSTPGGTLYTPTGFTITTDAAGNGTVSIPNTASSTLLLGHNAKIGTAATPSAQAALGVTRSTWFFGLFNSWFASVTPGPHGPGTGTLAQAVVSDGTVLLETWDAGTTIALRLTPGEAEWVDMGVVVDPEGDLQAVLDELTPEVLRVRVVSDPTIATIDDLHVRNLGINILAPVGGTVSMRLEWTGSADDYVIDASERPVFLESHRWPTLQSYEYDRLTVVQPTPVQPSSWGEIKAGYRR